MFSQQFGIHICFTKINKNNKQKFNYKFNNKSRNLIFHLMIEIFFPF